MLPEVTHLERERSGGDALTIWFNRPEARSALSAIVKDELAAFAEKRQPLWAATGEDK